ncbi:hypothetical protein HW555_007299 [Spodoptera exigua]|uniref:OAR domain-containing protein n=1 Tax=Spodoptera exigua TaxID=7107 RepID=A0A835GDA3_SPOEX|nr:hypothetical protein HW555_007299 [Spodoptera exigua]
MHHVTAVTSITSAAVSSGDILAIRDVARSPSISRQPHIIHLHFTSLVACRSTDIQHGRCLHPQGSLTTLLRDEAARGRTRMHRKSIEAARHLKESGSEREGSEAEPERPTSASSHHHDNHDTQAQSSPASSTTASSSAKGRASPEAGREMYEDAEAFRNNSIACLRAKAQEHQARILNHNMLLQVRGVARAGSAEEEGPADIDVGTEAPPPAHHHLAHLY